MIEVEAKAELSKLGHKRYLGLGILNYQEGQFLNHADSVPRFVLHHGDSYERVEDWRLGGLDYHVRYEFVGKVLVGAVDHEETGILQFFAYEHLPDHLRIVSKPFGDLARKMAEFLPDCIEREATLRKLLEAKDCAVRARLFK